jgi:hypothetical protein
VCVAHLRALGVGVSHAKQAFRRVQSRVIDCKVRHANRVSRVGGVRKVVVLIPTRAACDGEQGADCEIVADRCFSNTARLRDALLVVAIQVRAHPRWVRQSIIVGARPVPRRID